VSGKKFREKIFSGSVCIPFFDGGWVSGVWGDRKTSAWLGDYVININFADIGKIDKGDHRYFYTCTFTGGADDGESAEGGGCFHDFGTSWAREVDDHRVRMDWGDEKMIFV
jgi:hypothetical protein